MERLDQIVLKQVLSAVKFVKGTSLGLFRNKSGVVDQIIEAPTSNLGDLVSSSNKGFAVSYSGFNKSDVLEAIGGKLFVGGCLVADESDNYIGRILGQDLDKAVLLTRLVEGMEICQ